MSAGYGVRAVKALRLYCPIEAHTLRAMLAGEPSAMEQDSTLSRMLGVIRNDSPLGDFGLYRSVVEISPGWELFTPGAAARPALGETGSDATSPTAILTIYVADDAPADAVDRTLQALIDAHPWEVPVIEITQTSLLTRAQS